MAWFNRHLQSKECLGLTIDKHNIQMIQLVARGDAIEVKNQVHTPITIDLTLSPEQCALSALKLSFSQLSPHGRTIILAITDTAVFSQKVVTNIAQPNWRNEAFLAFADHIPVPIDQLFVDFQPLTTFKDDAPTNTAEILCVGCYRQPLEDTLSLLKQCALYPTAVELQSTAIERAYHALYQLDQYPNVWLCIEVTRCAFTLLLWSNQNCLATESDTLIQPDCVKSIVTQCYQHIMTVLATTTKENINAVWVDGLHPDTNLIESQLQKILGIEPQAHQWQQPTLQKQLTSSFSHTTFGLAFRGLQE